MEERKLPRKKKIKVDSKVKEKLDYIGLDLEKIPKSLQEYSDINFRTLRGYDEKKYKQYRFINVNDIEILLSPTNRINTIKEKYICTNFCRVLRFDNAKLASYSFLMLNMWYESNLFFNYEIGTTGLKNLNLDAVLSIELKKPTNEFLENVFVNFNNTYNIVQSNAQKIEKLNELKQLYLKKFFK